MHESTGWRKRLGAAGLALLVAFVSVATCYAGTRQMPERALQASCHGMTGGGDSDAPNVSLAGPAHDCCTVPAANLTFTTTLDSALTPSTDWVALEAPLVGPAHESDFASTAFDHSSPPTYLLISTFRI
jgi:hypothetical protein